MASNAARLQQAAVGCRRSRSWHNAPLAHQGPEQTPQLGRHNQRLTRTDLHGVCQGLGHLLRVLRWGQLCCGSPRSFLHLRGSSPALACPRTLQALWLPALIASSSNAAAEWHALVELLPPPPPQQPQQPQVLSRGRLLGWRRFPQLWDLQQTERLSMPAACRHPPSGCPSCGARLPLTVWLILAVVTLACRMRHHRQHS